MPFVLYFMHNPTFFSLTYHLQLERATLCYFWPSFKLIVTIFKPTFFQIKYDLKEFESNLYCHQKFNQEHGLTIFEKDLYSLSILLMFCDTDLKIKSFNDFSEEIEEYHV